MAVPVGAFVVIAAGLTMALIAWGLQTGWIAVALGSLIIIGPIGIWVINSTSGRGRNRAAPPTAAHETPAGTEVLGMVNGLLTLLVAATAVNGILVGASIGVMPTPIIAARVI